LIAKQRMTSTTMGIFASNTKAITSPVEDNKSGSTRTEFLIISRLARTPERIATAEDLWQYARGTDKPFNSESLHVYIYRLRNKLMPYKLGIDTMINVG
jgi:DNA-binding response OmpR family regulator